MPATEDYLRPLPKMHRWFAVSMLLLFGATLLMIYADHHDEWRGYQKQFYKLDAEKIAAEELKEKSKLGGDPQGFATKQEELESARDQRRDELRQTVSNLSDLERDVKRLDNEYNMQMRVVREQRAYRDVARADYDLGIRDQLAEKQIVTLKEDFDAKQANVVDLELELDRRDAARNEAAAKLKDVTKDFDAAVAAIKTFEADITRLEKVHERISPDNPLMAFKRTIMEWPIIDGFNSHMKVQQDWLPDIKQTLGMAKTARFDRCRTCHLGIDRTEAGDVPSFPHGDAEGEYPHPFSTHPRLDIYLTAASPHPLPEFGCTSCHEGQGSGTSFQNASHAPNDPHQAEEWEHKYKWFNNHFWEAPMMPKRLRESACLKCHHSVVELGQNTKFGATAPQVHEGWNLIQKYGCFGCHDINGFDAGKSVGPDLRLEPQTAEEAKKIADDPKAVAGTMRKVGPSLRHIASKTTPEWLGYWTEEPKRFRPTTTMPQFFKLSNQDDAHGQKFSKIELAALAHYFFDKSQPLNLDKPQDGYQPNADRGKLFFAQKGCLACHSHDDARFKGSHADFGPDLSKVHAKIKPGADGFNWVYTWIREPSRHHDRTRMPDLFLDPEGKDENYVDPAADIAAFLLTADAKSEPYTSIQVDDYEVDELVELLLARRKTVTPAQAKQVMQTRNYPIARENVKGDEIELVPEKADTEISDEDWRRRKMNYLGRVTISRYGCYGCHDIPNFDTARPIGTALQDWGLKDPSRLAPEHIEEYLHHHGEPDGSSTAQRIETALTKARSDSFDSHEQEERELSAAYFYDNLLHHGRAGFIWQKLRDPRSYDYEKTSTKFYDERLRMPKFPLKEHEIEAISTFVLGLVARPPAEKYQYHPKGAELAKVEGEKLLHKYNCVGCHVIDLPEIAYGEKLDDLQASVLESRDHEAGRDLLLKLKPPRKALTKEVKEVKTADAVEKLPVITFRGLMTSRPDPDDDPADQAYGYDLWETLDVNGKVLFPGERITVGVLKLASEKSQKPARGGHFAEWLVDDLLKLNKENNAWQMSPPPLYQEGIKVQTPWLYQFLKNPYQIRHTTVLRMPKFNMSDAEALALANYFAAYDGAPYPYQNVPQRQPAYLAEMNTKYHEKHPQRPGDYLQESWRVLNAPLCIKCHSLGGREVKVSDPKKDIRGPNLDQVSDRLQPDWMLLWFYKPRWITPYTSMPAPFAKDKQDCLPLFDGDAGDQTIAVRDVLANYLRLMEREGRQADTAITTAPAADATTSKEDNNRK